MVISDFFPRTVSGSAAVWVKEASNGWIDCDVNIMVVVTIMTAIYTMALTAETALNTLYGFACLPSRSHAWSLVHIYASTHARTRVRMHI